jgi:hypothetical protein
VARRNRVRLCHSWVVRLDLGSQPGGCSGNWSPYVWFLRALPGLGLGRNRRRRVETGCASCLVRSQTIREGGRIYRKFGVLTFQSVLRRIGWERIRRDRQARFGSDTSYEWHYNSRLGELTHYLGIAVVVPVLVWMIAGREWVALGYFALWAIPLRAYPIMLQRHLRPRFQRVMDRRAERTRDTI